MEGQFLVRQIYEDEITYNLIHAAVDVLRKFPLSPITSIQGITITTITCISIEVDTATTAGQTNTSSKVAPHNMLAWLPCVLFIFEMHLHSKWIISFIGYMESTLRVLLLLLFNFLMGKI